MRGLSKSPERPASAGAFAAELSQALRPTIALEQARAALDSGDLDRAEILVDQLHREHPSFPDVAPLGREVSQRRARLAERERVAALVQAERWQAAQEEIERLGLRRDSDPAVARLVSAADEGVAVERAREEADRRTREQAALRAREVEAQRGARSPNDALAPKLPSMPAKRKVSGRATRPLGRHARKPSVESGRTLPAVPAKSRPSGHVTRIHRRTRDAAARREREAAEQRARDDARRIQAEREETEARRARQEAAERDRDTLAPPAGRPGRAGKPITALTASAGALQHAPEASAPHDIPPAERGRVGPRGPGRGAALPDLARGAGSGCRHWRSRRDPVRRIEPWAGRADERPNDGAGDGDGSAAHGRPVEADNGTGRPGSPGPAYLRSAQTDGSDRREPDTSSDAGADQRTATTNGDDRSGGGAPDTYPVARRRRDAARAGQGRSSWATTPTHQPLPDSR